MSREYIKLVRPPIREAPSLQELLLCISERAPIKASERLSLEGLSRTILHTQGCRGRFFRTAPSAGATYPMEIYIESTGNIFPIPAGLYWYRACSGKLERVGDRVLGEEAFLISAVYRRTTNVYGRRGYMYVHEELGHILQNLGLSLLSHGISYSISLEASRSVPRGKLLSAVSLEKAQTTCSYAASGFSFDKAVLMRKSIRRYLDRPIHIAKLEDLLKWIYWNKNYLTLFGEKTSTIDIYLVLSYVEGLEPGVYLLRPDKRDRLEQVKSGRFSAKLGRAALGQKWVSSAPLNLVLVGNYDTISEVVAGAIGQNVYLASTSEGLGTVAVGAFFDEDVAAILGTERRPLYIMPIGYPAVKLELPKYTV